MTHVSLKNVPLPESLSTPPVTVTSTKLIVEKFSNRLLTSLDLSSLAPSPSILAVDLSLLLPDELLSTLIDRTSGALFSQVLVSSFNLLHVTSSSVRVVGLLYCVCVKL